MATSRSEKRLSLSYFSSSLLVGLDSNSSEKRFPNLCSILSLLWSQPDVLAIHWRKKPVLKMTFHPSLKNALLFFSFGLVFGIFLSFLWGQMLIPEYKPVITVE